MIRYERDRPGEMIHLDIKKLAKITGIGHRFAPRGPGMHANKGHGWDFLHVAVWSKPFPIAATRCSPTMASSSATPYSIAQDQQPDIGCTCSIGLPETRIEHRFTKPNHPWTSGQVERMNHTLNEATVRRYHFSTHQQLSAHLSAFLDAYNFANRLKTLSGLTPYEGICKAWTNESQRFLRQPNHLIAGPNNQHILDARDIATRAL